MAGRHIGMVAYCSCFWADEGVQGQEGLVHGDLQPLYRRWNLT